MTEQFKTQQEAALFRLRRKKFIRDFEKRYGEPQTWQPNLNNDLGLFYFDSEAQANFAIEEKELLEYIQALRDLYLHYRGDQ